MERKLYQVHNSDKLFYYFSTENETNNLIMHMELCCRIDRSLLKKALNKTLSRYPNFRRVPVLDEGGFVHTVELDREAEVYAYDPDPVNLGTRETGGFLFRVMVEGKSFWISIFHALCDGGGFRMFIRTLLYYYFTFAGVTVRNEDGGILTADIPADPSEMADPFDLAPDAEPVENPFKPSGRENILILPEPIKGVDECREFSLYRFVLDAGELIRQSKEADTTVDTYFHLLTARTIHENYDCEGKQIAGIGTIDVRPFFDNKYLQNNVDLFWLYFEEEFFRLSDKDACEIIAKDYKAEQLNKEVLGASLKERKDHYKELFSFPLSFKPGLRTLRENILSIPDVNGTYFITNVMRFDFGPDIDPFVTGMEIYGTPIFASPVLFLLTQGDKTFVTLVQRNFDRYLACRLRDKFKEKGLLLHATMGGSFENDKVRIDDIPVIR